MDETARLQTKSITESVLDHAVTKYVGAGIILLGMVKAVVLPIQEIQIHLVQLQADVLTLRNDLQDYAGKTAENTSAIAIIQQQLRDLKR